MAIEKIISIENIGRLRAYKARGDLSFKRYNLVFAENGRGKSTLSAILRSMRDGDDSHIKARYSVGATAPAKVDVRINGLNVKYDGKSWDTTVPNLAIFDALFTSENVHSGDSVGTSHRRNLLQIMLGAQGVNLAKKVGELDEQIRNANTSITERKRAIARYLEPHADVDDFVRRPVVGGIATQIKNKKAALEAARQAGEIQTRTSIETIPLPSLPEKFDELLDRGLKQVSTDAEKKVREQIEHHHMGEDGEEWLSQGLAYVVDDKCPFCGSAIARGDQVKLYKEYFSDAYDTHRSAISDARSVVIGSLGDTARARFVSGKIERNKTAMEFWKAYVPGPFPVFKDEGVVIEALEGVYTEGLRLIDKKLGAPLDTVNPDKPYKDAVAKYETVRAMFDAYNEVANNADKSIAEVKRTSRSADPRTIQAELKDLELTERRHADPVKTLCEEYVAEVVAKKTLDTQKDTAKDALDAYAETALNGYQEEINRLLSQFGTGFTIHSTVRSYVGGAPTSSYQLMIDSCLIDLGDDNTTGKPCFKTSMSSGDKSALALAFFLAHLDKDASRSQKIVVFDDPFTSFDRSRREQTVQLIKKFGESCAQVVVLSHDPSFLKLLSDRLDKADTRQMQISRAGVNSTLEDWDADKENQGLYFKDRDDLRAYIDGTSTTALQDVARKIRPVLEGYMRIRFAGGFPDNMWLGDMIGHVRTAGATHPLFPELQNLSEINDYSKRYHHETNPNWNAEPISDGELKTFVNRTLFLVGGY
ncbi:MAG: AAA family ATPase [Candidatus Paceibacterota bacterium]|jgi:wobble nucleotide-excising tRNase